MGSPTPLMAEPNRADTYLPVAADVGHRLRATATYTDDHGPGQTAAGTTPAVAAPGTITFSADPPTPCAHVEATLTDADGGINTESADSPPNFSYGWQWDPPPASSSSRSPVTPSTTRSYLPPNSVVGQTIGVRVQYGDNASDRNTVDTTSAVVQANVPRTPLALRSTPGDRRVSLVWGAPDDCGSRIIEYAYRYRKSSASAWPDSGTVTGSSKEITGLDNGVTYQFEVRAVNAKGRSQPAAKPETPVGRVVSFQAAVPPYVGVAVTAELSNADGLDGVTWAWQRVPSEGDPMMLPDTNPTYTPVAADVGHRLRAKATYLEGSVERMTAALTPPVTVRPGVITLAPSPPQACADLVGTLTDPDGGINTRLADSPPGFPYGWQWRPESSSSSARSAETTSTNQDYPVSGRLAGQKIRVTVQYGDNASSRNTADTLSGVVQANVPKAPTGLRPTPGDRRVSLVWTAPDDDCGSTITEYAYRYRKSSASAWPDSGTAAGPSAEITDLDDGVTYRIEVRAVNAEGRSEPAARTVGIPPSPRTVSFGASSYVAREDTDTATVTLRLLPAAAGEVAVPVTVRPGPHTEPADFAALDLSSNSTVSFAAGASTASFRIAPRSDADTEDESVLLGFGGLPDRVLAGDPAAATVSLWDATLKVIGPDRVSVEERTGVAVAAYRATDARDVPVAPVTWSRSGDDADRLRMDGGGLEFVSEPDYEEPADAGGDNAYEVKLQAHYGPYHSVPSPVTVTVTDGPDPGMVILRPDPPVVGEPVTATLADADAGVTGVDWSWLRVDSGAVSLPPQRRTQDLRRKGRAPAMME